MSCFYFFSKTELSFSFPKLTFSVSSSQNYCPFKLLSVPRTLNRMMISRILHSESSKKKNYSRKYSITFQPKLLLSELHKLHKIPLSLLVCLTFESLSLSSMYTNNQTPNYFITRKIPKL